MKIKTLGIVSFIGFIISGILIYLGFFITETGRHSPDNCTKTVRAEVIGYDYMYTPDEINYLHHNFNLNLEEIHMFLNFMDTVQSGMIIK